MKRFITLFVAFVILVTLSAGCGTKPAGQTNAPGAATTAPKLTGSIVFSTQHTDIVDTKLKAIADQFMLENPGTTVEFEALKDIDNVIQTRLASNANSDIFPAISAITSTDLPKYFAPIDDLGFTQDKIAFYINGVCPTDNKQYALNSTVNINGGIIYNKAVFKQAGIDKTPTTLDEFYAVCDKIKAAGVVPFATNFKDQWPLGGVAWDAEMLCTGDPISLNKLAGGDELLIKGQPGMLNWLDLVRSLSEKGYTEPDLTSTNWDAFCTEFPQGKFGMAYLGSWYPSQFIDKGGKPEDIGYFPFPGAKGVIRSNDYLFGINKDSKNIELAKAFMKYCWTDDRLANACGTFSPLAGAKYDTVPWIKELTSYVDGTKFIYIDNPPDMNAFVNVQNQASISLDVMVQEYVLAKDPQTVIDKYNQLWKDARAKLAGK